MRVYTSEDWAAAGDGAKTTFLYETAGNSTNGDVGITNAGLTKSGFRSESYILTHSGTRNVFSLGANNSQITYNLTTSEKRSSSFSQDRNGKTAEGSTAETRSTFASKWTTTEITQSYSETETFLAAKVTLERPNGTVAAASSSYTYTYEDYFWNGDYYEYSVATETGVMIGSHVKQVYATTTRTAASTGGISLYSTAESDARRSTTFSTTSASLLTTRVTITAQTITLSTIPTSWFQQYEKQVYEETPEVVGSTVYYECEGNEVFYVGDGSDEIKNYKYTTTRVSSYIKWDEALQGDGDVSPRFEPAIYGTSNQKLSLTFYQARGTTTTRRTFRTITESSLSTIVSEYWASSTRSAYVNTGSSSNSNAYNYYLFTGYTSEKLTANRVVTQWAAEEIIQSKINTYSIVTVLPADATKNTTHSLLQIKYDYITIQNKSLIGLGAGKQSYITRVERVVYLKTGKAISFHQGGNTAVPPFYMSHYAYSEALLYSPCLDSKVGTALPDTIFSNYPQSLWKKGNVPTIQHLLYPGSEVTAGKGNSVTVWNFSNDGARLLVTRQTSTVSDKENFNTATNWASLSKAISANNDNGFTNVNSPAQFGYLGGKPNTVIVAQPFKASYTKANSTTFSSGVSEFEPQDVLASSGEGMAFRIAQKFYGDIGSLDCEFVYVGSRNA